MLTAYSSPHGEIAEPKLNPDGKVALGSLMTGGKDYGKELAGLAPRPDKFQRVWAPI